ncbi:MAG: hypothetical protein P8099_19815, partial [Gemmatimonadota bacterium]
MAGTALAVAVTVLALSAWAGAQAAATCLPGQAVYVADDGLRAGVRAAVGLAGAYPPLGCDDLRGLTRLDASGDAPAVASLDGLQYASNLTSLRIEPFAPPPLPDPAGSAAANAVEAAPFITAYQQRATTPTPTLQLTAATFPPNLQHLSISGLHPSDLEAITTLRRLDGLTLDYGSITDLSAFETWAEAPRRIDLSFNRIHDIHPLATNPAIASGDWVRLWHNCLDLGRGSQVSRDLRTLRGRGVTIDVRFQQPADAAACRPGLDAALLDVAAAMDADRKRAYWLLGPDDQARVDIHRLGYLGGHEWTLVPQFHPGSSNPPTPCAGDEIVHVADPPLRLALQRAVLGTLQLTGSPQDVPLTCANLRTIARLRAQAPATPVASLGDVAYAANLTEIALTQAPGPPGDARQGQAAMTHSITDLRPLTALRKLRQLTLTGVHLPDLGPLAAIDSLQSLALSDGHVGDLAPLIGLSHLQVLRLHAVDLRTVTALRRWAHPPPELDLSGNRIHDIQPLADNAALATGTVLDLDGNCLDLGSGATRRALATLRGRGASVSVDAQAPRSGRCTNPPPVMPACSGDASVDISDPILRRDVRVQVSTDALVTCSDLKRLQAFDATLMTPVQSLEGLQYAPYLTSLRIRNPPGPTDRAAVDISALAGVAGLRSVSLDVGGAYPLEALTGLPNLAVLALTGVAVPDIGMFGSLPRLRVLTLRDAGIRDLTPLSSFPYRADGTAGEDRYVLAWLSLPHNAVADLKPLVGDPRYGRPGD